VTAAATREGPDLAALVHRLAECPPDFLEEPRIGDAGIVDVAAVVWDLMFDLIGTAVAFDPAPFVARGPEDRARLRIVLVASWLFHDAWFRGKELGQPILIVLANSFTELAALVPADKLVRDDDRREELARLCLARLGLTPKGETPAHAADRLAMLDSVERYRVVLLTQEAEARAKHVREALKKKAAEEAAAKVSRE
jgi:hypothetical protein